MCSVFAGGFDLASAAAVAGTRDEYVTLNLLDGLVRKSLVVADRAREHTRFSMLETIRQYAEEQLVATVGAEDARTAHAHYFARCEDDILALWNSPRQGEAYEWLAVEIANLRAAFRWAADHDDLDTAATIAFYAALVGTWTYQLEPIAWAAELLEPARTSQHRRLAQLYSAAAQCHATGRIDDAVSYADASQSAIRSGVFADVPYEYDAWAGAPYLVAGQPQRWINLCRNVLARYPDTGGITRTCLVMSLTFGGAGDEAIAESSDLLVTSEATHNPSMIAWARLAYGIARRDTDPEKSYAVHRTGLAIALGTGNRLIASHLADALVRHSATHGHPSAEAFDHIVLAIRIHQDAGSFSLLTSPLASLAALFDRLELYEPAATISGYAANPTTYTTFPEMAAVFTHVRDMLGHDTYESLAGAGAAMTDVAMVSYALEQIDLARAELP
jgi:hypothetical protein